MKERNRNICFQFTILVSVFLPKYLFAFGIPSLPSTPTAVSTILPQGMEFVTIPSGSFMMGSSPSEADRCQDEGPRHSVSINTFELMTTEVTQGMWEEVMGTDMRYYRDITNPDGLINGEGEIVYEHKGYIHGDEDELYQQRSLIR